MRTRKSPSRLVRVRRSWRGHLLEHRCAIFGGLAILWVLYFSFSALKRPGRGHASARAAADQLRSVDFERHAVELLRDTVRKVVRKGCGVRNVGVGEPEPLLKSVESVCAQLLAAQEDRVPCNWDAGLETDLEQLEGRKYLLAANFKNNEQLLPHVILQMWQLLATLPQGSAFVSIYESGSKDSTGLWLEVLRHIVTFMRVPHRIVAGGKLVRRWRQPRIDFLAQVRNAALEPLWLDSTSGGELLQAEDAWPADRVVFLNDVFFCAKDVIRLLLHDADMACGMDFDRRKLDHVPKEVQRQQLGKSLQRTLNLPAFVGQLLGWIPPILYWHSHTKAANRLFQKDLPMGFYDLWVGRDANGALFLKDAPYATDPYSLQRLPWGLPFPVKCCWNGLVALNAAPFTRHGIRMRSHIDGECAASECTLLCNDFLRLGYQNLIVDPGVRQAYKPRDARDLYHEKWVRGINTTKWAEVRRAPPLDRSSVRSQPLSQCCGLKPGKNVVQLETGCIWENYMLPNFTAMASGAPPDQMRRNGAKKAPLHERNCRLCLSAKAQARGICSGPGSANCSD